MKKSLLILVLTVSTFTLAQRSRSRSGNSTTATTSSASTSTSSGGMGFKKGDFSISGQFGISSDSETVVTPFGENTVTVTTIGFEPSAQYFLTNDISLGGTIGFRNRSVSNGGDSVNTFIFGAFGRYYFSAPKQFSLFGQAGFGVESTEDVTAFTLGVKPGLSYFLSNHFAIEATLGEVGVVSTEGDTDFNFGLDFRSVGIGVLYKF